MSPRTPTMPPTEPTMWRKLLARLHLDAGVSHELLIWTNALKETVVETATRPRYDAPRYEPTDTADRVPLDSGVNLDVIILKALEVAETVEPSHVALLKWEAE